MKKTSATETRGSLQLASKLGPVSEGAAPPVNVAPWQAAHDRRYRDSPAAACASVYNAARAGAPAGCRAAPISAAAPIENAKPGTSTARLAEETRISMPDSILRV